MEFGLNLMILYSCNNVWTLSGNITTLFLEFTSLFLTIFDFSVELRHHLPDMTALLSDHLTQFPSQQLVLSVSMLTGVWSSEEAWRQVQKQSGDVPGRLRCDFISEEEAWKRFPLFFCGEFGRRQVETSCRERESRVLRAAQLGLSCSKSRENCCNNSKIASLLRAQSLFFFLKICVCVSADKVLR